jgi:hypothetical protein
MVTARFPACFFPSARSRFPPFKDRRRLSLPFAIVGDG